MSEEKDPKNDNQIKPLDWRFIFSNSLILGLGVSVVFLITWATGMHYSTNGAALSYLLMLPIFIGFNFYLTRGLKALGDKTPGFLRYFRYSMITGFIGSLPLAVVFILIMNFGAPDYFEQVYHGIMGDIESMIAAGQELTENQEVSVDNIQRGLAEFKKNPPGPMDIVFRMAYFTTIHMMLIGAVFGIFLRKKN